MSDAPVTRPDLEAIQARVDAATDGPWHVEHGCIHAGTPDQFDPLAIASMLGSRAWLPDALFMAAAREDVPALLAALAAERARADQAEQQMTVDQFREAVGVERASHAARGYDEAHDRTHGVPHLLRWALDYASCGEAVKSGALIVAALHLSEALEREERTIRARADQAEQQIADALQSLADSMPRYGMELRPDGSEDPLAAAYVEGYGTAYQPVHAILSAAPTAEQES